MLSQSPKLDKDRAIHSRRNGLIESTPAELPVLVIVSEYRHRDLSGAGLGGSLSAGLLPATCGALLPTLGEQLGRALDRDRLDLVALAQARVRLTVGHIGTETPLLDHD